MATLALLLRLGLALAVFRALALPLARLALPRMSHASYALAGPIGIVIGGHLTWLLVHAGMRLGAVSIGCGLAVLAVASWQARATLRKAAIPLLPSWRSAVAHHLVFSCVFALALAITARNPAVDPDSERFMDYAMINAVLASRTLPLEDPWLAGERLSYYDYGYYSTAYLSLFAGPPERFFGVAIALVYAALSAGMFAVGRDLAGGWGAGLATFLVAVSGNLDGARQTVIQTVSAGPLAVIRDGFPASLDWFHSARVLDGGIITEFPFFALLWGDLHPYALALPLWPILIAVAWALARDGASPASLAVGAATFAALIATHTWDAVPAAALLLLTGSLAALARPASRAAAVAAPLTVIGIGAVLAIPFLEAAPTGGRGLALVELPSAVPELLNAWGAPLLIAVVAAAAAANRLASRPALAPFLLGLVVVAVMVPRPGLALIASGCVVALTLAAAEALRLRGTTAEPGSAGFESPEAPGAPSGWTVLFGWAAVAIALGLIAGVELLHVDDHYSGELARMNTVFKAYFEAWVLFGVGSALLLSTLIHEARRRGAIQRSLSLALVSVVVIAGSIYPVRATTARAGALWQPISGDARYGFRMRFPDDALAVEALAALPRGVVLETTGDPYTWSSRFSSFTGFPTIVGWAHHEAGWLNSWDEVQDRSADVHRAYESGSLDEARQIFERYGVQYVVVGALERERYEAPGLAKLERLESLIRSGETVVYSAGLGVRGGGREALPDEGGDR